MLRLWNMLLLSGIVLIIGAQCTHGQAYLFTWENSLTRTYNNPYPTQNETATETTISDAQPSNNNNNNISNTNNNTTKIIVYQNTVVEAKKNELSQTAMDVITIIWYIATFLALAAFFMLMACSDRRCRNAPAQTNANGGEVPMPPPTPSPSYSEFAPPSYETVLKMQHAAKPSVFVIPFATVELGKDDGNISNHSGNNQMQPGTPVVNVYTVNELQKSYH